MERCVEMGQKSTLAGEYDLESVLMGWKSSASDHSGMSAVAVGLLAIAALHHQVRVFRLGVKVHHE